MFAQPEKTKCVRQLVYTSGDIYFYFLLYTKEKKSYRRKRKFVCNVINLNENINVLQIGSLYTKKKRSYLFFI